VYGFDEAEIALLRSLGQASAALGSLFGGVLADLVSRCLPLHGRPFVAQASSLLSFPLCILPFLVPPPESWAFIYEASMVCGLSFFASWSVGACLPMLANLAPWGRKSGILAWHGALQGGFGCLVALGMDVLAPRIFGHDLGAHPAFTGMHLVVFEYASLQVPPFLHDPVQRAHLEKTIVTAMSVSWVLSFSCYSLLHWSYPGDVLRVQLLRSEEAEKACTFRSHRARAI